MMRPLPLYYCAVFLMLTDCCRGWSYPRSRSGRVTLERTSRASSAIGVGDSQDADILHQHHSSRREACQALITSTLTICSAALLAAPIPAHADVTNKIASSTALRSLSIVQRQLPSKLLPVVQSNNFIGVKTCLREPPFDNLRKDMLTVVRGGEDGPKANELLVAYKQLIKSFEAIDATCSLGMRGRSSGIDPFQLGIEYDEILKAMDLFISVGSEAGGIPLQEDSTQTKIGGIDVRSGKIEPRVL